MKNLFIILICLEIFGCKNSRTNNINSFQNDSLKNTSDSFELNDSVFSYNDRFIKIESIKKDDFVKYPKYDFEKDYDKSNIIKYQNDTLKLFLDSAKSILFTTPLVKGDGIQSYKHLGDLLNYYIIEINGYESTTWTLIDKIKGTEYNLVSPPYLSPNKKYILSFGGSFEYITPPEFQIWTINDNRLMKKAYLQSGTLGFSIEDIRWINDDKLVLKIGFSNFRQSYGIMTIK